MADKMLLIDKKAHQPFKTINEMFKLPDTSPCIIAGPCAIENEGYLDIIGRTLADYGIRFIRGGAYKPRSSPYTFQGLREDGLKILNEVSKRYCLFSVTEVVDTRDVELVSRYADILQIGSRNMQNFELLKMIGQSGKPVLLKRGICASLEEFKLAAEYVALEGCRDIIMCERGIKTFDVKTRNLLDICCIPILKNETSLPVMVDISHSLGRKDIMPVISRAVLAAGADGIMVEVHPEPAAALSDAEQQLSIDEFKDLLKYIGIMKE